MTTNTTADVNVGPAGSNLPDARTKARQLGFAAVGMLLSAAVYTPTYLSMEQIWARSETFAHGYFVFPIALFLIWKRRGELRQVPLTTDLWALLPLAGLGMLWLVANVTDVLVVQQVAVVLMLPAVVWLMLGFRALRVLSFPLLFLLFAVPMGEALIYPLMKFTASFTVHALRLTGIPVYWDGTFFSIPSGDWSVVEGCSGVRYLIASVFLGVLYAYMVYRALWRRLLFIALATVVPIIANGFRAYFIVMIAHLSDMKLALGVDHFIYGWVWFGIVMFFLFWLGALWRDDHDDPPSARTHPAHDPERDGRPARPKRTVMVLAAGMLVMAIWPVWAERASQRDDVHSYAFAVPDGAGGWQFRATALTTWKPDYQKPSAEAGAQYTKGGDTVGLYLAYYGAQTQGAELVNSQNVMVVQKHPVWRMPYEREISAAIGQDTVTVWESKLESASQNLLVWHWYWIGGHHLSDDKLAKLYEAYQALFEGRRAGAGIVVFTELGDDADQARERLRKFLGDMLPAAEARLDAVASG